MSTEGKNAHQGTMREYMFFLSGAHSVRGAPSASGAHSVRGAYSVSGAHSVSGARSVGGAPSVSGAPSVRGAYSVRSAHSVRGAYSVRSAHSVSGARSVGGVKQYRPYGLLSTSRHLKLRARYTLHYKQGNIGKRDWALV